jgi:hypothetical protein
VSSGEFTGRLLVGAVAGIVGTAAMSIAMQRLFERLPAHERYPLPPREIVERLGSAAAEPGKRTQTLVAHVGFGAAAGALMALASPEAGPRQGSAAAIVVWLASYFGWVPALRALPPASAHPPRRNALMIAVHLLWGATTAATTRELGRFRDGAIAGGPCKDARRD